MKMSFHLKALAAFTFCLHAACSPSIGDKCKTSTDCSVNGDRLCDRSLPGGYCTVKPCDPDTCADNARCVEWRYKNLRNAVTTCMKSCSKNSDCRRGDGYRCVSVTDERLLDEDAHPLARIIDQNGNPETDSFCSIVEKADL